MRIDHDGRVAVVTMDHQPAHTLTTDSCRELSGAMTELDGDTDVGAIVVTGSGGLFSAGADLRWGVAQTPEALGEYTLALDELFLAPSRGSTPVIAAVTGHAIAGGGVLVAACHYAVATTAASARFGLTELAVGVPFPPGAFAVLRRRFGRDAARVVLRADLFGGEEAARLGMVDELVAPEDVLDTALAHAARLAALPAATTTILVEQLTAEVHAVLATLPATQSQDVASAWASDEGRASIQRFVTANLA